MKMNAVLIFVALGVSACAGIPHPSNNLAWKQNLAEVSPRSPSSKENEKVLALYSSLANELAKERVNGRICDSISVGQDEIIRNIVKAFEIDYERALVQTNTPYIQESVGRSLSYILARNNAFIGQAKIPIKSYMENTSFFSQSRGSYGHSSEVHFHSHGKVIFRDAELTEENGIRWSDRAGTWKYKRDNGVHIISTKESGHITHFILEDFCSVTSCKHVLKDFRAKKKPATHENIQYFDQIINDCDA